MQMHFGKVTRVEIIDETGRGYVNTRAGGVGLRVQDDEKTLKIFTNDRSNQGPIRTGMTNEEYEKACTEAAEDAGWGPGWNARYELALLKRGLKIVSDRPPRHPLGNDVTAPPPALGELYQYPYPSWIVEQ